MIRLFIRMYMFIIFIDVILSYFPQLRFNPIRLKINKLSEFICGPIRKFIPPSIPIDISPMVAIFILSMFIEIFALLW